MAKRKIDLKDHCGETGSIFETTVEQKKILLFLETIKVNFPTRYTI